MNDNPIQNKDKTWQAYLVTDETLLYKIANAGLLDKLRRVAPNKFDESKRVWFFDKHHAVGEVIRKYKADKKAENIKTMLEQQESKKARENN